MKPSNFPCALLGAGAMLLIAGGYVLFGPMDFLGFPEPRWATILFYPGIWVGVWTWHNVAMSIPLCHAAGVATMALLGGALGAVLDLLINPRDP